MNAQNCISLLWPHVPTEVLMQNDDKELDTNCRYELIEFVSVLREKITLWPQKTASSATVKGVWIASC